MISLEQHDTLPKVLRYNHERSRNGVALREKAGGVWRRYLWRDYYEQVKLLCLGLVSLGLEPGDKVALLSETKPQVFWAELAAQAARATAVGIFSDCTPPEVKYYMEHSDSRFVFAQDQEQVDKILEIKADLPLIEKVIHWERKGLWFYDDPCLMNLGQVLDRGRAYEQEHPEAFEKLVDSGRGDDIAVIIYTSGTTGAPKGAMLSFRGMLSSARAQGSIINLEEGDEWLAFMPMAWIGGQGLDLASPLIMGLTVNFPEKPETVQENIRELGPRGLMFSPRQWEALNRMIQARMSDAGFVNRIVYRLLLSVGLKKADRLLNRETQGAWERLQCLLAELLLFRPLRDKIGLKRTRVAFSGGGAISPDIIRFFHAIGVNLKQIYGSSEMGLLAAHGEHIRPETCGTPLPGVEIRLSDEGEILVKTEWRLVDYYKNPEALKSKIRDGWYQTGDFGHIDEEGHLIVMDRMEDLRLLANGRKFSPQYTEIRLRFSPYIKEAIVVGGEDRPVVGAIINIDMDNAGHWAESRKLSFTTFADLSQKPEIIGLVKDELSRVNATLPEHARIRRFMNLHKEFDADESELTRSRKLRRGFLEDKYAEVIAALYGDRPTLTVETPVTYRDGRRGLTKSSVRIISID
ncbi:MAG: AMP-binding protein [Proteobacteria bacterium]|nr:AMP-binding protein [Pseudomonadota bacterium]